MGLTLSGTLKPDADAIPIAVQVTPYRTRLVIRSEADIDGILLKRLRRNAAMVPDFVLHRTDAPAWRLSLHDVPAGAWPEQLPSTGLSLLARISVAAVAAALALVAITTSHGEPPPVRSPPSLRGFVPAAGIADNNILNTADYPKASLDANESGITRVVFVIGTDGRAETCTVTQSSGYKRLDDTTCAIIKSRFRYAPALPNGRPVKETRMQLVRWKLVD